MATYSYKTQGVCSRRIDFQTDGEVIEDVKFEGGCDGNLKAISKLVRGMKVDDVIEILEGNTCGFRSTSCADQLAQALKETK